MNETIESELMLFPEGFAYCTDFQRGGELITHGPRLSKALNYLRLREFNGADL